MQGETGRYHGYTKRALPAVSDVTIDIVYYYDNYDFNADGNSDTEYNLYWKTTAGFSDAALKQPQGQLTGRRFFGDKYEVVFYDNFNRVVQTNDDGFCIGNRYFFNGLPKETNYCYKYTPTSEIFYTFSFSYDHNWRPYATQISWHDM